jgi:hypothetical protein
MDLRNKYSQAVATAKSLGMEGSAEERNGKLHFKGTVKSGDEKNQIWNALKTVPDWVRVPSSWFRARGVRSANVEPRTRTQNRT